VANVASALQRASTTWKGCADSKQGKWNRKTRRTRKWAIDQIYRAQCLKYLKATGLHLCLLLSFDKPHRPIPLRHRRPLRIPRVLRFHFPRGRRDRIHPA
jgi:hypothetical protein